MQQQIRIPTAIANATANTMFAQAAIVTNAAARAHLISSHEVSKRPDPGKPGKDVPGRWRVSGLSRCVERSSCCPVYEPGPSAIPQETGMGMTLPAHVAMPPSLWATWVLGKSLCG